MTRRLARRAGWVVLGLVLALLLPARGAGGGVSAPEKLIVGVSAVAPGQGGLLMAKDTGLFQAQGLDVEFVFFGSSTEGMQALISGQVPVHVLSAAAVVHGALAGADAVLIAGLLNTIPHVLVVAPEVATPADLKGKVVGINRFGSSSDLATRFALTRLGLDPERDVTLLQLGGSSQARLAALKARSVHGTLLEPTALVASRKLGFPELADLSRLHLRYSHEGLATSSAFTRDRPETLRKLIRGLVLGTHAFKTRQAEALQTLRAYLRTDDSDALSIAHEFYARAADAKPYAPIAGIQTILDELASRNPRAKTAKPEDFLDMRFVRELDESGFIDRLYR